MPPLMVPPLVRWAIAAAGGAAIVHWALREIRRINEDLDHVRSAPAMDKAARQQLPTLKRDSVTGEWRLM